MVSVKQLPIYLLGALITQAIPVITLPVLTRHLAPAEYGLLVLVQAVGLFSASFFSLGLTSTFERNFFDREAVGENKFILFWSSLIGNSVLGLVGGAIFSLGTPILVIAILKTEVSPYFVCIACIAATLRINLQLILSLFRNQSLGRTFFTLSVVDAFAYSFIVIFWLNFSGRKQLAVAEAQFFSTLTVLVVSIAYMARKYPVGFDLKLLKDSLALGYPTSVRQIVNFASSTADKVILNHVSSLNAVGLYSLAQRASIVCFYFISAIDSTFLPRVWELMFNKGLDLKIRSREIGKLLTPYFLISALVAAGIIIFAHEAVLILADPSYGAAAPIIGWLTLFYLLQFFGKLHGRQIMFGKMAWATVAISVLSVLLVFGISYPLANNYGLLGLTLGTLTSGVLVLMVANWIAQRQFRIEWERARMVAATILLLIIQIVSLELNKMPNWTMVTGLKVALFLVSGALLISLAGASRFKVIVNQWTGR